MAEAHKRKRHPKYRKKYKVRNWSEYDRSLRSRGDLTIWLSEDVIDAWVPEQNGKRGRQRKYSDISIEAALSLRLVFHLALRQTEGFLGSILSLMNVDLSAPDHTTISRRNKTITPKIKVYGHLNGPVDLVVDSTGLSIHGDGKWTRHKHGKRARRGWRKLHIMVDHSGIILSAFLTDERVKDADVVPDLIKEISRINSFTADGGYDEIGVYKSVHSRMNGGDIVIPPRSNAIISANEDPALRQRNQHIKDIESNGIYNWRRASDYYRQSTIENTFYRYKQIIGDKLKARDEDSRQVESILACNILNLFRVTGRPESELVQ